MSSDSPHRGLTASVVETNEVLALLDRHQTIAQPLFLATRLLLAKRYRDFPFAEAALELGTGSGDTGKSILGTRKLCVGSTPIIDEVMGARANFSNHRHYMAIDAAQIPFDGGCFNTVTMNYTFYHLEDAPRTCREVIRVLQPGGCFAFNFLKRNEVAATRVLPNMLGELGLSDHASRADRFVFVDYGASGSSLTLEKSLEFLAEAGFEQPVVTPYLSTRLSKLIWLVRDLEIIFGLSAITGVSNVDIQTRYRQFCAEVIAPLLARDDELCRTAGSTFAFVTTTKPGSESPPLSDEAVLARRRCPRTGARLVDHVDWLTGGGVDYPVLRGIPLTIPVYADIWAAQNPGIPPEQRPEFRYLQT